MTKAILTKLTILTGKVESLQRSITNGKDYEVKDAIADAKDSLMKAIRLAEQQIEGA